MPEYFQPYENIFEVTGSLGQGNFQVTECEVQIGSYGQLSTAKVTTCLSGLEAGLSQSPNGPTSVGALTNPQATGNPLVQMSCGYSTTTGGGGNVLFGGNYMHGLYTLEKDEVELWGRDYAGVMFDYKESLAALQGGYQGLTVNQFVTNIANQFGLTPNVTSTLGRKTQVGYLVNINQAGPTMSTVPKSLWDFIVYLARWVGANVYTDPQKNLWFVDNPTNPDIRNYMFGGTLEDIRDQQCLPILGCQFLHQPQRNSNFAVCVISAHKKSVQVTASTVFVAGQPLTVQSGSKTKAAGIYTGSGGRRLQNAAATAGLGIPIYYLRMPELTPDMAQAKAQGLAMDIASRLVVVTMVVDLDYSIVPLQQVQLQAGSQSPSRDLYGFAGRQYYVSHVKHSVKVPQGEGGVGHHTVSVIRALTVPPPTQNLSGGDLAALGGG